MKYMKNALIVLVLMYAGASSKIIAGELSLEDVVDRMTHQERTTYNNYRSAYQASSQAMLQKTKESRAYKKRIQDDYAAGQLTEDQYEQGLRDYLKMLDAQVPLSKQDINDARNLARFVQRVRDRLMQEDIAAAQAHREREQKRAAQQEPEEEIVYLVPPIPVGVAPYTPPVAQEVQGAIPPPPPAPEDENIPGPPADEDDVPPPPADDE